MASRSLSTSVLAQNNDALIRASQHPFLTACANGRISPPTLIAWLSDDIVYQHAYIRFVGGLLTQLQLPDFLDNENGERDIRHRALGLLVDALVNLKREMGFYEDTCRKYGLLETLEEEINERKKEGDNIITGLYVNFFQSVGSGFGKGDSGFLEGLVALWATEECYLRAWTFASQNVFPKIDPPTLYDQEMLTYFVSAHKALREAFIPNWSCQEFQDFVGDCRNVMNEYARHEIKNGRMSEEEVERRANRIMKQVCWLEERFWPTLRDLDFERPEIVS